MDVVNIEQTEIPPRRTLGTLGLWAYGEAPVPTMSTERFVHLRNLELLRVQLMRTTDEVKCQRIVKLIEDEELTYRTPDDDRAQRRASETTRQANKVRRPAHR